MPASVVAGALAGGIVGYVVGRDQQMRPTYAHEPEPHIHLNKRTISLGEGLIANEWQIKGNTILVESVTGLINVRFNSLNSESIALHEIRRIVFEVPFWRLFFDAPAQPRAFATLVVGTGLEVYGHFADILPIAVQLRTNKNIHFTGAIAQNAIQREIIHGLFADKIKIVSLAIQSRELLRYRVIFFSRRGFTNTDINLDEFRTEQEFDLPTWGWRIGGTGQFYMSLDGLSIEYEDKEQAQTLYLALQNRSVATKSAGAAGEVVLEITYEPRR